MAFKVKLLSSLTKVFAEPGEPGLKPFTRGTALAGEVYAIQAAYYCDKRIRDIEWMVDSPLKDNISVREVGVVPAEFLSDGFDENMLRISPGMFPDPLLPCPDKLKTFPEQWRSLWLTIKIPQSCAPGAYPVTVSFCNEKEDLREELKFELEVIPAALPEQQLGRTEWFHADCLAELYHVPVWNEKYWTLLEKYFCNMVDHGINQLLTPLFTLPLDTAEGGERPTCQLVDVFYDKGQYRFDFSRLERWIDLADAIGFRAFEFSHLFSQWGAKKAPKVIVNVDGEEVNKFGWDTDALGEDYTAFLDAFLPELMAFVDRYRLTERCCFHISDEPHLEHLEHYAKVAEFVKKYIPGKLIIDAASNTEYYDQGICENPIPAINEMHKFLGLGIDNLWTYYCCGPWENTTNRYFNMPLARTRGLGVILFKYDFSGFLHWGYNFWFSRYSKGVIDPFKVTDAGGEFPAGDPFLVYPGEDGPVDSIRHETLREGFQDHRALKLLESLVGRTEAVRFLEDTLGYEVSDTAFPKTETELLRFRESLNERLKSLLKARSSAFADSDAVVA